MEMKRYQKEENFSPEKIAKLREHYKAILELLGEDPAREGLLKTPEASSARLNTSGCKPRITSLELQASSLWAAQGARRNDFHRTRRFPLPTCRG